MPAASRRRTRRGRSRAAFTALLVALAGLVPPAVEALTSSAPAATPTSLTPVMGPNLLSADQLARWYKSKHSGAPRVPSLGNDITRVASVFIEEGRIEGVRGDLAFVQSALETGWFTFPDYGQIRPEFNNFAGINAFDGRPPGTTCAAETAPSRCFSSARIGVRNQIHLLRGYADPTSADLPDRLRLPPADRIGVAPIWELFGGSSGKAIWATAPDYGLRIIELYSGSLVYNGARAECLPYSPGTNGDFTGEGYWLVTDDGGVHAFGKAHYYGSAKKYRLAAPIVGAESNSDGNGYWLVGRDGGVFTFGRSRFLGSTGAMRLNKPVNGIERTVTDRGYWLVADDGGVFSFGDARFYGSTGGMRLNKPVLGMERTASGKGYWLFSADGGIFSFGDAKFYGSLGDRRLRAPIVAMQRTPSGKGYWMLGAHGQVYSFGDARKYGSIYGCNSYQAASRLLISPTGAGYWIATAEGTVIAFGDARRHGSPAWVGGATAGLMLRP